MICAALLVGLSACDSRANESDAEADRNSLIVLGALLQGDYDVRAACLGATQGGLDCAGDTGLPASAAAAAYAQVSQLVYNVSETPTGTTAAGLCDELIAQSQLLSQATAETRRCFFACEAGFWNAARSAAPNSCNAGNYANLPAQLAVDIATCSANCIAATPRFYY